MWRNAKYDPPNLTSDGFDGLISAELLIWDGDTMYTAVLEQPDLGFPAMWRLLGRDGFTYELAAVTFWRPLPPAPIPDLRTRVCGNASCAVSSGDWEDFDADGSRVGPCAFTFGSGELRANGEWEFPCHSCARASEERDRVPLNSYWPFGPKPQEQACTKE
jgi:hypothetical protein